MILRIILDTNLFIAAYWAPRSASARIIKMCINGKVKALYSRPIRDEVSYLLGKIGVDSRYVASLESFWNNAEEITPVPVEHMRVADPDDQKFLEAAVGGDADFVVTNDEHLLSISYIGRTEILTPVSMTRIISTSEEN